MMKDAHPETIEFEIDRVALRRYTRQQCLLLWMHGLGMFALLPGFAILISGWLEGDGTLLRLLQVSSLLTLATEVAALLLAVVLYFSISHWRIAIWASSFRVMVDGSFLRVIEGYAFKKTDRKIHFRDLVDYAVTEGPLLNRHGLKKLVITTTRSGRYGLMLPGIKDCERARDLLAEVDAAREGPPRTRTPTKN